MVPAGWVAGIAYKPGWKFRLGGPGNRFLCVFAMTADSLAPGRERVTQHMFELPDEPVDLGRWLLDRLLEAERHEACEFLSIGGVRRFWPNHQDEGNPYEIVDRANVQLAHFGCNSSKNNRPTARGEQLRLIG